MDDREERRLVDIATAEFVGEMRGFMKDQRQDNKEFKAKLAEIEKQTRETNGRVTKIENKEAYRQGAESNKARTGTAMWAAAGLLVAVFCSGFSVILAHFLGAQ